MKKNRLIIMIFIAVVLFNSCNATGSTNVKFDLAEFPIITQEPSPNPTPVPTQAKYVFIVIADGLGRGGMMLGEIYARVQNQSMKKGAQWEDFDYQSYVYAMSESASGGTAIASGVMTNPWYVGVDKDGNPLYTIMDRAKQNGMSTGVVTNSILIDATPATFMTHSENRYSYGYITNNFSEIDIDYISGGGLSYIVSDSMAETFSRTDCMGVVPTYNGPEDIVPSFIDRGYETYLGLEGAITLKEKVEQNNFKSEKSIGIYTENIMPYEYYKYNFPTLHKYETVPSLIEMTEAGIQTLSQNPNGFTMMIEAALIDKCGHRPSQEMTTHQVNLLNNVLKHLVEFYNEHPYETLIVFTADHETGDYTHNDEVLDDWKSLPKFRYLNSGQKMTDFISRKWELDTDAQLLQSKINKANEDFWGIQDKNRARLNTLVTMEVAIQLGIEQTSSGHSIQSVPLFAMGLGSQEFRDSKHIYEVPIIICEIMGWEALPEVLEN